MKFLRFLSNEFFLGTLITILSIFTAVASYQGGMADPKQNEFEQCRIPERQPDDRV
jgi:hypothetical protein